MTSYFQRIKKKALIQSFPLSCSLTPKLVCLFPLPAPGSPCFTQGRSAHLGKGLGQSSHASPLRSPTVSHTPDTTIPTHFSVHQRSLVQLPLCRPAFILYLAMCRPQRVRPGHLGQHQPCDCPGIIRMSGLSEVQEARWAWQGRTRVARAPWFSCPNRFVVAKSFIC